MRRAIALALGAALLATGCGPGARALGHHPNRWVPVPSDVMTAALNLGVGPVAPQDVPQTATAGTASGRAVIEKLVGWLRKVQRLTLRPPPEPAYGVHLLTLTLRDGKTLTVSTFYVENAHGGYHPSSQDVMVGLPDGSLSAPYRAPALAKWLDAGWQADMPLAAVAPPPSSGGATNPALQKGGLRAAEAWIGQHEHSVAKTISLAKGGLILTQQPGWAVYVDTSRDVWEQIPLPVGVLTFERQTADGALLFLVHGPFAVAPDFPFPYQVLCTLYPEKDDLFVTQDGPKYYPVAQGVSFGNRAGEVVTSVYAAGDDIRFGFGPKPGGSVAFFAGSAGVPRTTVSYDAGRRELVIDFAQAPLAQIQGLSGVRTSEIEKVSLAKTAAGVQAVLTLAPGASYYTGEITHDERGMPYVQMAVIAGTPPSPWGP